MISFIRLLSKNSAIRAAIVSFIILFGLPTFKAIATDASILPQGVTQFTDNDGNPLSTGKVYFYTPNTLTFKTTWQNAAKSVTNTNPVNLDAGGRAIIYGDGVYRQIVKDSAGTTIYDAVTTAPLTGSTATLVGDGNLVSTVLPWAGLVAPAQYVFGYGQEIARATYPDFFTATTSSQTVSCTLGSPLVTGLADTTQIIVGTHVELSCVAAGTTVLSKTLTTATLSANSSASTTATAVFFPWGNGNGTTTFNVPDLRGYNLAGRDNMGGTASARLVNGNGLGRPLGIANFTYVASDPFTLPTIQTKTVGSGTYTPTAGMTYAIVEMFGGGGGGGASATNAGNNGTASTFTPNGGSVWTADFGRGGAVASGTRQGGAGGAGGSVGTGTQISGFNGQTGGDGTTVGESTGSVGGSSSCVAGGGLPTRRSDTGHNAATNSGGGGGGGYNQTTNGSGGGGGGAQCQIFLITAAQINGSAAYVVGAKGTGGAAGTNAGGDGADGAIIVTEYYTATPTPVSTSFIDTTAGTLQQVNTINYVVKVTPDTSTSSATGVASLGGMTGVITCGSGLLCTGNIIDVNTSANSTPRSLFGNSTAAPTPPTALTSFIISGSGQFGTTSYVAAGNYAGAVANSNVFSARGTVASPITDTGATAVFQLTGNPSTSGTTLYASYVKRSTGANIGGRPVWGEAADPVGGVGSYIEGARFGSTIVTGAAAGGNTTGIVSLSIAQNTYEYIVGHEAQVFNLSGVDPTTTFSSAKFAGSFLASCGQGAGGKCDFGYATNPFNFAKAITGYYVSAASVEDAAFRSDASTVYGVDFTRATLSTAAFASTGFSVNGAGAITTSTFASIGTKIRAAGTAPALTVCGTSPAISGSDLAGEVTMGTAAPTGCIITFNVAYSSAPYCTVSWQATPLASQSYVVSTTAITTTQTATSSNKLNYTCIARSAG